MANWRRNLRIGVIAVASFVLLVTVLPQVANAIGLGSLAHRLASTASCSSGSSGSGSSGSNSSTCCSGSSGSSGSGSSSGCSTGSGTVTGKISIMGAPKGFSPPYIGAGACPITGPTETFCANPTYVLTTNGAYSLSLSAGTWVIAGFYELAPYGGAFIGPSKTVTVSAGGTVTAHLTVPYAAPAELTGTVQVTGVPTGVTIQELEVVLCPSWAPITNGFPSIACVTNYVPTSSGASSASFSMTGLPPGSWIAYSGYLSLFGSELDTKAGKHEHLISEKTTVVSLRTPFLPPSTGFVEATIDVTGAPAGFTAPLGAVYCDSAGDTGSCSEGVTEPSGDTVDLLAPAGTLQVSGFYEAPVFDNAILGASQTVRVRGGHVLALTLTVPYQVLGTAAGSIKLSGLPHGVHPTAYFIRACPSSEGQGDLPSGLACVVEFSGSSGFEYGAAQSQLPGTSASPKSLGRRAGTPLNSFDLPTLTPGTWSLWAGYDTIFGSYSDPVATTVTIAAGQTTTTTLHVQYQEPSIGAVTGTVSAVAAPLDTEVGVRACTSPPSGIVCSGEQDAFPQGSNGTYQLDLTPGRWWLSGFAYVYAFPTQTEYFSSPVSLTVRAGIRTKQSFIVQIG